MIKKLKLKFLFFLFIVLSIVAWSWGGGIYWFVANKILHKPVQTESASFIFVYFACNFFLLTLCIAIFSVIFFRLIDKSEKIKEQAEKERLMLFANIAHDLKTPITSVLGYSKALADGVVQDEAKKSEYLQTIHTKAGRMNDLIDRLFEYVKLESPENALHKKDADVAEILRKSVANLYTDFEEHEFNLEIEIPETSVIKNVDSLEIDRVFTNLLTNALKHNPNGTNLKITMDEKAKIVIADNGNPIPEEVKSQIFKPFVSGDESRTSKNGSGLGLALAHKIMEKHGGSLSLVSPYDDGTVSFTKAFVAEF